MTGGAGSDGVGTTVVNGGGTAAGPIPGPMTLTSWLNSNVRMVKDFWRKKLLTVQGL